MTPASFPKLRKEQREKQKGLFLCRIGVRRGGKGRGVIAVAWGTHTNGWYQGMKLLGIFFI